MGEDLKAQEDQNFRAPDQQRPTARQQGDKDYEYRAKAFMSEDLRSLRDDAKENPDDKMTEGLLQYAEKAQDQLVEVSAADRVDPSKVAVGLGFMAGRAERTHLSMQDMMKTPDVFDAEATKKLLSDYQTARTMVVKTGEKLFPAANTGLNSENYQAIVQKLSTTGDGFSGTTSYFKDGINPGGIEYFLSHPDKNNAINLEAHLGEMQYNLSSEIDGLASQLAKGDLSEQQTAELSRIISVKSEAIYQLQAMRNQFNRTAFGRENILPNEIQELQQARHQVEQVGASTAKTAESSPYMSSGGESVPISREAQPAPKKEVLKPDFKLITVIPKDPLENWTNDQMDKILLGQLKKSLAAQMGAGSSFAGGMRSEARIKDLQTDIANIERYMQGRSN